MIYDIVQHIIKAEAWRIHNLPAQILCEAGLSEQE